MTIERLSAEDALMLWPDARWPQDVGALVLLEGGRLLDDTGRFDIDVARQAVAARLDLVPRFHQLLHVPPRRLGGPFWADAPRFEIAEHVLETSVPAPADERQLLLTVECLRRRRLDPSRPLWEMWFLTGLPDRRLALFIRFHHAIADGMAGIATMASFLDADPDAMPSPPAAWSPEPSPTVADLLQDVRVRQGEQRRQTVAHVAHPIATGRRVMAALPALRELVAERPYPVTSLDLLVGQDRNLALTRARLDLIKDIAHANRAKVNDVLLTAIAGGIRALLISRGEAVEGLSVGIYVAVSLHRGVSSEATGNLISQMAVPLPVDTADPMTRLRVIAESTAERKALRRPSLGGMPHGRVFGRALLWLIGRQHINVMSSDLPGPNIPLYFAGARLLEVFPMVQLIARNSLAVGALSYAGGFNVMAVADRDGFPDLALFMGGFHGDLETMAAATPPEGSRILAA